MSRIFIRGDTHGRLQDLTCFRDTTKYTASDYVIICGDFGFVFDSNEYEEEKFEKRSLDIISRCECTFIIVGGNHENYNAIECLYPIQTFKGARARYIRSNVIWIERGEVFTIDDKKFWCFGGAYSIDKSWRTPNVSWWEHEEPNDFEMEYGLRTLEKSIPDYIITHECPASINMKLYPNSYFLNKNQTIQYMERVLWKCEALGIMPIWYFGHHHREWDFENFHCRYDSLEEINI